MLVTYRRCKSDFTMDLRFPVYGGEDGSIVIFNHEANRWEQLNQTHDKTNSYWVVSIRKKSFSSGEKPRLEKDVHKLICSAWKGEPPSPKHRVDHINGNPDDNRADNLRWISALDNARKANLHEKQFPAEFDRIIIDCVRLRNGGDILNSVSINKTDGTSVTAMELVDRGRGRPPTRIGSLLEALYMPSTSTKADEKTKYEIDINTIESDNKRPFPDEIRIRRGGVVLGRES